MSIVNYQLSGDGVVATAAPRVTGEYTLQREPASFERAVFADSFQAIIGAGRQVSALATNQRGKRYLVQFNQAYHNGGQTFAETEPDFFQKIDHKLCESI